MELKVVEFKTIAMFTLIRSYVCLGQFDDTKTELLFRYYSDRKNRKQKWNRISIQLGILILSQVNIKIQQIPFETGFFEKSKSIQIQ